MPDLLEDAARHLVAHPVRPPTSSEVLAVRWRIRRRRRVAGLSAGVVVAGVAALVGLVVAGDGAHHQQVISVAPSASAPASGAGVTPPGWVRVDYGDASIAVPAGWEVIQASCGSSGVTDAVILGALVEDCPASTVPSVPVPDVQIYSLPASAAPAGRPIDTNGHAGGSASPDGSQEVDDWYTDLGVGVVSRGPQADQIAGTVGWSQRYLALHPTGPVIVPTGWKKVLYDGVRLQVPASWPVDILTAQSLPPGTCNEMEFVSPPTVYVGSGSKVIPSCQMLAPNIPASEADPEGVWIRAYPVDPPPVKGALEVSPGVYVLPATSGALQSIVTVVITGQPGGVLAVDVGVGSDVATAQEVLASIATEPRLLPVITFPLPRGVETAPEVSP